MYLIFWNNNNCTWRGERWDWAYSCRKKHQPTACYTQWKHQGLYTSWTDDNQLRERERARERAQCRWQRCSQYNDWRAGARESTKTKRKYFIIIPNTYTLCMHILKHNSVKLVVKQSPQGKVYNHSHTFSWNDKSWTI